MKRNFLRVAFAATAMFAFAACSSNKQDNNTSTEATAEASKPVVEVQGRTNFKADRTLITPQPCIMIATYDANQNPDVMMAAWGGQYGRDIITFELSSHQTTDNIRLKKAFTVSYATMNDVAESDYFGLVSARDVKDKVARVGYHAEPSPNVDAPIIKEYPLTLECKVISIEDVDGVARIIGQVVNMSADEKILTDGNVDFEKLKPVAYDATTRVYREIGKVVGGAWDAGKRFQN